MLSGGERARLCMAGVMLSQCNVLILDEPGNHLDVDSVESLAEALLAFKGTVIFTSHDRHFMKRVASHIIEVRDGRVVNYHGDYEAYLYSVNKEIEEGERELAANRLSKAPVQASKSTGKAEVKAARRNERDIRKELNTTEKLIARLDGEKKKLNEEMLNTADAKKAMQLHEEITKIAAQLTEAEDKWVALSEELADA